MKGRVIFSGAVKGEALVTKENIGFLGGVNPNTGIVIEKNHELEGKCIKDKILVFPSGKGSTVGSYTMLQLKKNNVAPKAIINKEAEPIVAVGAIISEIPMVDKIDISSIRTGDIIMLKNDEVSVSKHE
ncbi:MAG: DUF126 domain-containing protein [Candidatus Aenigmatarchaeota archaeon]